MHTKNNIVLLILLITAPLILSSFITKPSNPAFDRIRPIIAAADDALQHGDSLKALSFFTEALVRGQEWPETEEEMKTGKCPAAGSRADDPSRHGSRL